MTQSAANILTLHLGHNASALLVQNACVTGAVSQERFNNTKNADQFPDDAIGWLLGRGNIGYADLDRVGVCGLTHADIDLALLKAKLAAYGVSPDKIVCLDHHECHAYSPVAFYPKVDSSWLVFTADNEGDGISSTISTWDGKELKRLAASTPSASLGYLYGLTTEFMGMKMGEHEYKVMGLAAYAKPDSFNDAYEKIFKDILALDNENPLMFISQFSLTDTLEYLKKRAVCGVRFDHLAGALQHCLEENVLQWVRNAIKQTGLTQVMTGGSVFMNVKLNKRIREMPEVSSVRFMPSCGDESLPIGAAYVLCKHLGIDLAPLLNLYQGQSYTDDEIEVFLREHPQRDLFTIARCADMALTIADMLAEHKVVARFAGRAEFGARSLGNRAILAHPSDMRSFYTVNDHIKARDFWMPFAPTILDIDAPRYLDISEAVTAPYMIDAFETKLEGREALCAALHQGDKTVRPQILTRDANPAFYKVIECFKAKTGLGGVLNTSLNLHGSPLAATPERAVSTLLNSGLNYLAMGTWLISKK